MKRTKIVCTIGPASNNVSVLKKMMKNGMNVARLNFSHGTYNDHRKLVKNVRAAAKKSKIDIALLQDLQGPRIRVGELPKEGVEVKDRSKIVLVTERMMEAKKSFQGHVPIPIQYNDLYKDVKKGDTILIEDGTKRLKVEKVSRELIFCKVVLGGVIKSHKGINVPGVTLNAAVITRKDKADLEFGISQDVDYIALSFVKDAKDIKNLRKLIQKHQKKNKQKDPVKIIAKIERQEAIENLDEIIHEVDGIMVARGDLGIELPPEQVPLIQKQLITKCQTHAKPVIVATQMLDSMVDNLQPTRAEVSDVANAVIDHTDAVMLSAESAVGKHPAETVLMMAKIAEETENSYFDDLGCAVFPLNETDSFIAHTTCEAAKALGCKAIIVITQSGSTGRLVSRNRPELPIVAFTSSEKVKQQLVLSWGVKPFVIAESKNFDDFLKKSRSVLTKNKLVRKGDKVAFTFCYHSKKGETGTNLLKIETI